MATSTKAFQGMFEQLGIDMRTQEQILSERAQQQLHDSAAAREGRERFAGQHSLEKSGKALGTMLTQKFIKPKLSEKEQLNVDAMARAQEKFEEKQARGDFQTAGKDDLIKESEGFNRAVASELLRVGDPRGMELARSLDATMRARQKDDLAQQEAGLRIDSAIEDNAQTIWDNDREQFLAARGEIADIWTADEQDPNAGFGAMIDDEGVARTANGAEFPLGTYTTARPTRPKGGASGTGLDVKDYISLKNLGAMQQQHRGLVGQFNMAVAMADAISDGVGEDGTLEMMGSGGKVGAGVTRLLDNLQGLGRQIGSALEIEDADGKVIGTMTGSEGGAAKYARDNQDLFNDEMIPESIRGNARATARYQAIIVQFAYGKARLNEENGRISDNDFKNAVLQIGANATDPEALRQILVGDLNRAADNFNIWDKQMPPALRDQLIHPQARVLYDEAFENFNQRFGQEAGTALNPGPMVTEPQGEPRDFLDENAATPNAVLNGLEKQLADLEAELEKARR